jgi:lambda family phage tail tape measure protein
VNSAANAFTGLIDGTMNFKEAMAGLMKDLARYAAQRFFLQIFGSLFGGAGGLTGGFGSLFGGFADGGYTGDGGKHQPAGVVHRGEYVMSKSATKAIGVGNLEALHQSARKGYSGGGLVGGAANGNRAPMARSGESGSAPMAVTINAPVTVNGSSGTPEQNNDLAKKMARQMEGTFRGVVVDEMRRQQRPGNMLNNGRR